MRHICKKVSILITLFGLVMLLFANASLTLPGLSDLCNLGKSETAYICVYLSNLIIKIYDLDIERNVSWLNQFTDQCAEG